MGLFGDIGGRLLGDDKGFEAAREAASKNRDLLDAIKDPVYAQYAPELYSNESANYELINDNPLLKSAQMAALAKMAGLADSGLSDVDQAGYEKARDLGGQMQKAGTAAAMENAAARGVGGSGLEFATREIANQEASRRAQDAALTQAADSARQRALYAQAYGNQLAGVRSQDAQTATANAGIINQFNQMNTQNRNATNNANVNSRNDAFKYNEGLKDKTFNNQMARATGQMANNNQMADIAMAQSAQNQAANNTLLNAGLTAYGIANRAPKKPGEF